MAIKVYGKMACAEAPDSFLALKYQVEKVFSGLTPSHNIVPNQEIVIINDEGGRQLIQCKRGFIPFWTKVSFRSMIC
jgi:putative SOS response-associated peptidase YedK